MLQIGRYSRRGTGAIAVIGPLGAALVPQDWAEESRQALAGRIELVPWLTRLSQAGVDAAVLDLAGPHALLSLLGGARVQALALGQSDALDWRAPIWGWGLNPGDWECLDLRLGAEAEDVDAALELVTEDLVEAGMLRIGRPMRDETGRFEPPDALLVPVKPPAGDRSVPAPATDPAEAAQEPGTPQEAVGEAPAPGTGPVEAAQEPGTPQEAVGEAPAPGTDPVEAAQEPGTPQGAVGEAPAPGTGPAEAAREQGAPQEAVGNPKKTSWSGPRHLWVPDPTQPSGIPLRDRARSARKRRHLWVPGEEPATTVEEQPGGEPEKEPKKEPEADTVDEVNPVAARDEGLPSEAGEASAPAGISGQETAKGWEESPSELSTDSFTDWVWSPVGRDPAEGTSTAPDEGAPSSSGTGVPSPAAPAWVDDSGAAAGTRAGGNPEFFEETMTPETLARLRQERDTSGPTVMRRVPQGQTTPTAFLVYAGSAPIEVLRDVVIGREPDTRILTGRPLALPLRVPSPNVEISRSHCAVMATAPGTWSLMDLGSANGSVLIHPDGTSEEVTAMLATALTDGDRIDLGEGVTVEFRVRLPAGP